MEMVKKESKINIILGVIVLLVIYNLIYWLSKFFVADVPAFMISLYVEFKDNWNIMVLLEFLAVASIFVDTISNYDSLVRNIRRFRFTAMVLLTAAFIARFIIGMIDLYVGGGLE
jgi:cation transport ATPase